MSERRVERWLVTPEFLVEFAKRGEPRAVEVVDHALPDDARYVAQFFDLDRACVCLLLESASFAPVLEGEPIPLRTPTTFRRLVTT